MTTLQDKPSIMIVEAPYYADICKQLVNGAINVLEEEGATYRHVTVPGALEIPAAVRFAVRSMEFNPHRHRIDGYIALGCVIRGETTHYDHVCNEMNRGLMDLSLRHTLAIGNGVLTVENADQARARADASQKKNLGAEAARACLHMIKLKTSFGLYPRLMGGA